VEEVVTVVRRYGGDSEVVVTVEMVSMRRRSIGIIGRDENFFCFSVSSTVV
jgi:hypothetical protein